MNSGLYEILALAARYFFAGLFLLIVLRAWRVTVRDGRRARKLRRWSPETGLSGELVVLEGDGRARRGMRYPVIREGTLGSGRAADVRVRHASLRPRHARFELRDDGLLLSAAPGARLADAQGKRARRLLLRDGDRFYAGSVLFMLVLIDAVGRAGDYAREDDLFSAPLERPAPEPAREEPPVRAGARRMPDAYAPEARPQREPWPAADDLFDTGGDADEDDF